MKAMTRDFYRPNIAGGHTVLTDPVAEYYEWEEGETSYAMGFGGKRSAPDFHYRFKSAECRDEHVENWLSNMRRRAKEESERRAERSKPHSLKVGSILSMSWGYDQTNVNFFEVTKLIGKTMAMVVEIGSEVVENNGPQMKVVAVPGSYKENGTFLKGPTKKKVRSDNSVYIASYADAHEWDGSPMSETGFGWGH